MQSKNRKIPSKYQITQSPKLSKLPKFKTEQTENKSKTTKSQNQINPTKTNPTQKLNWQKFCLTSNPNTTAYPNKQNNTTPKLETTKTLKPNLKSKKQNQPPKLVQTRKANRKQ